MRFLASKFPKVVFMLSLISFHKEYWLVFFSCVFFFRDGVIDDPARVWQPDGPLGWRSRPCLRLPGGSPVTRGGGGGRGVGGLGTLWVTTWGLSWAPGMRGLGESSNSFGPIFFSGEKSPHLWETVLLNEADFRRGPKWNPHLSCGFLAHGCQD